MARGRKPDTPEQQADKGAPGKRMSQAEATAIRETKKQTGPITVGGVRAPKWLKKSRTATQVWNDLAPRLARINLLTDLDAQSFARYCRYVVEWIAADLTVQKEGTWFETVGTNGEPTKKRHPAWQACQDLEKLLRDTEANFGMRPDARYKIMRDQALSQGALPLFDDPDGDHAGQGSAPPNAAEESLLGTLGHFDSLPPERMN